MGWFDSITSSISSFLGDQQSRLTNVLNVEEAAITGSGITANTSNTQLNNALEGVANHPFVAAAAVPTAIVAAPAAGAAFTSASLGSQALVVGGGLVGIGAISSAPGSALKTGLALPSQLTNFGGNVGTLASNPTLSNAEAIFKENPVIASATTVGILGVVGAATSGTVATILNTQAMKANTEATKLSAAASGTPAAALPSSPVQPSQPLVSPTAVTPMPPQNVKAPSPIPSAVATPITKPVATRRKAKKKKASLRKRKKKTALKKRKVKKATKKKRR